MIDFDRERTVKTARHVLVAFGIVTLAALVANLYELTLPVDAMLAVQAIAIFVRVLHFNDEIKKLHLSQPDD